MTNDKCLESSHCVETCEKNDERYFRFHSTKELQGKKRQLFHIESAVKCGVIGVELMDGHSFSHVMY